MEITLIENASKSELAEIKKMIGEAFVTNELFHEFGDINDRKERVPLLFDTDMERYAQIYQHYGCELYNQTLASNGVTRYSLVWMIDK